MRFLNRLQQHQRAMALIPGKPRTTLGYVGSCIFGFKAATEEQLITLAEDAIRVGLYIGGQLNAFAKQNPDDLNVTMLNSAWFYDKVDLVKSKGIFVWKRDFLFPAFQNVEVSDRCLTEFFLALSELTEDESRKRFEVAVAKAVAG